MVFFFIYGLQDQKKFSVKFSSNDHFKSGRLIKSSGPISVSCHFGNRLPLMISSFVPYSSVVLTVGFAESTEK